jgi:hypothetical protein
VAPVWVRHWTRRGSHGYHAAVNKRRRAVVVVAVSAIAVAMAGSSLLSSLIGETATALLVGAALFLAPGYLLTLRTRFAAGLAPVERPSLYFVASLALLVPSFAAPLLLETSFAAFLPAFVITTVALAVYAFLGKRSARAAPRAQNDARKSAAADATAGGATKKPRQARWPAPWLLGSVAVLAVMLMAAAWLFTATGSIDRWWYLAYVRGYLDAPVVNLGEPFLSGRLVVPRFGINVWLLAMAAWAKVANVDPVWLYERACPLLLVPLAFSSALFFARSLFRDVRTAWLAVLASALLWMSGSLFPVATRLPEDKLFALIVIAPVTMGAFIRAATRRWARWLLVLTLATIVQAMTHALVYAFVLLALLPFAGVLSAMGRAHLRLVAPLVAVLLIGAAYPAATGTDAKQMLESDGAAMTAPDHPVVRVHMSRARLVELEGGGYVVEPGLLAHPLVIFAFASLILVLRRRALEKAFLIPATLLPLAIAFVPPLTRLAGDALLPWMVYRILWVIPFAALIAVGVDELGALLGGRRWLPALILIAVAIPWITDAFADRTREERQDLAMPDDAAFHRAMDAIAALPRDAIVVAGPEVSERIPALTGRHVLAASDRATVVFAGSRARAEDRLRERASIMTGMWTPGASPVVPTHVLFDPGSRAERYCGEMVVREDGFELCAFAPAPAPPGIRLRTGEPSDDGVTTLDLHELLSENVAGYSVSCRPARDTHAPFLHWPRPGPWSARFTAPVCTVASTGAKPLDLHTLIVRPILGAAVEELTIAVTGGRNQVRWRLRTRERVHHGDTLRYRLPRGPVDEVRIEITPSFLPFVKLQRLALTIDGPRRERERHAEHAD